MGGEDGVRWEDRIHGVPSCRVWARLLVELWRKIGKDEGEFFRRSRASDVSGEGAGNGRRGARAPRRMILHHAARRVSA